MDILWPSSGRLCAGYVHVPATAAARRGSRCPHLEDQVKSTPMLSRGRVAVSMVIACSATAAKAVKQGYAGRRRITFGYDLQTEVKDPEMAEIASHCPGCGQLVTKQGWQAHLGRCCPEMMEGSQAQLSKEHLKQAILARDRIRNRLHRTIFTLRYGLDLGGRRRTPYEVSRLLGGTYEENPERIQQELRKAQRYIPLVADDPSDLEILYEDEDLLAVSKPASLRTSPVHRFVGGSLLNQVVGYLKRQGEAKPWPHLLETLNEGTSGVFLIAKNQAAEEFLGPKLHLIRKEYLALAWKRKITEKKKKLDSESEENNRSALLTMRDSLVLQSKMREEIEEEKRQEALQLRLQLRQTLFEGQEGEDDASYTQIVVEAPIHPDPVPSARTRQRVDHEAGRAASTCLRVCSETSMAVLLEAEILNKRERKHQVRVHTSHLGLPIIGDSLYGVARLDAKIKNVLEDGKHGLHLRRIVFPHPTNWIETTIEAPVPADFASCAEELGLKLP
eukprot:TRINITY_DN48318_c0_g1_i1.p1 TRINITY_DN48318_c0_g1~~TRINITY_DN48318_c0_g1_i1.p1  ORF type:complete len:513 (+),score=69.34 TRINITY_DN48318_c0_g1_i1:28-1539(+)